MNGTKGFRTREAAANHRNRNRRLVSEDVRLARFANLHGNDEAPAEPVAPVEPEIEVTPAEAPAVDEAEQAETPADEASAEADAEGEGDPEADADESEPQGSADKAARKKKAGKAKK